MKLDEVVKWYQKKIGTYDKQQWEKTVEQKILDGFSSVTLKNAKLKTELIDVDLVRGSTFPKAKPKQSLLTVIRLAILRYLFLPIYAQWWVRQTSPNTFALLLFLYITQMINSAVYTFNINRVDSSNSSNSSSNINNNVTIAKVNLNTAKDVLEKGKPEHIVSLAELLIPMGLSLLISLIHSQIVATNSISGIKSSKHRRFSNTNCNGKTAPKEATRLRRRKKLVKMRSQELVDISSISSNLLNSTGSQRKLTTATMKHNSAIEKLSKPSIKAVHMSLETATNNSTAPINNLTNQQNISNTTITTITNFKQSNEVFQTTTPINQPKQSSLLSSTRKNVENSTTINDTTIVPLKMKLDLNTISNINIEDADITGPINTSIPSIYDSLVASQQISNLNKKRNVNWHSPIHNYAIETQEKQQQTSPQTTSATITTTSSEASTPSSSSNSSISNLDYKCNNIIPTVLAANPDHIDDCVQEFFDDLITRTVIVSSANKTSVPSQPDPTYPSSLAPLNVKRNIGEDDGFESLNGKSSSGEETHSPLPLGMDIVGNNQLRLRLNAVDLHKSRADIDAENIIKQSNAMNFRRRTPISSESDDDDNIAAMQAKKNQHQQQVQQQQQQQAQQQLKHVKLTDECSDETDEEGGVDGETISSPPSIANNSYNNECTTSATEWLGVTTNSEDCSYSSELENSDYKKPNISDDDYDGYDLYFTPTTILNPHGTSADRISCTIWDQREIKKAQMSVLEISSCIIERVESMPETNDYIYIGIFFSFMLSLIPSFCRLCEATIDSGNPNEINYLDVPMLLWEKASFSFITILRFAFGHTQWERTVLIIGYIQRICLTVILFIIFAVAERTFKQRFLYAKLFSHLTSSRRARKSNLPHFRLNKVRNIKTWLSVRSYLKKRGPQRSVDVIVSAAFIVTLLLLAFLSVEWLKDSVHLHSHLNLEALMWSTTIGLFLLRFMTLGNKIHDKYRSVSVLITEQINLYLQIEQKPKKKDELMVSNSVLKLAADLLKELETPFKISGLSANPYLFTTIKVVILSALSGVLSEMLGFKLKLHKIKIK